jgi:hypothetical protein
MLLRLFFAYDAAGMQFRAALVDRDVTRDGIPSPTTAAEVVPTTTAPAVSPTKAVQQSLGRQRRVAQQSQNGGRNGARQSRGAAR